jgi:hypothetical protein
MLFRFLQVSEQKIGNVIEKTFKLIVKVVDSKKNSAIKEVNIKIFRIEKEPISPEQWVENLKNGAAFKRLILVASTDNEGIVTVALVAGSYEVKLEAYSLSQICELTQNKELLFIEPKKHLVGMTKIIC